MPDSGRLSMNKHDEHRGLSLFNDLSKLLSYIFIMTGRMKVMPGMK